MHAPADPTGGIVYPDQIQWVAPGTTLLLHSFFFLFVQNMVTVIFIGMIVLYLFLTSNRRGFNYYNSILIAVNKLVIKLYNLA